MDIHENKLKVEVKKIIFDSSDVKPYEYHKMF